jgi:hypothetical protein
VFTEDEVDPEMKILADVVTLKGSPLREDEFFRRGGPGWKNDIVDILAAHLLAEFDVTHVLEEGWHVEELGDEFFDVGSRGLAHESFPDLRDVAEESVGQVKAFLHLAI